MELNSICVFFCSLFTIHKQIEWSRSIAEYRSVFSGQSNGGSSYWLNRIKLNQDNERNSRNNSIWKKFGFLRTQQSDESLRVWEQWKIHEEALKIWFLETFRRGEFCLIRDQKSDFSKKFKIIKKNYKIHEKCRKSSKN